MQGLTYTRVIINNTHKTLRNEISLNVWNLIWMTFWIQPFGWFWVKTTVAEGSEQASKCVNAEKGQLLQIYIVQGLSLK